MKCWLTKCSMVDSPGDGLARSLRHPGHLLLPLIRNIYIEIK